ncbi:MAG TPA: hypothetical protein VEQ36_04315, partial [Thermomicrobiales bacterium]|nr:hypothetical protein [Thermomicrobiales bacterium]
SIKVTFSESIDVARALLPVANGATTELVDHRGKRVNVIWAIPPINAAGPRADRLAAEINRILSERGDSKNHPDRRAPHASE